MTESSAAAQMRTQIKLLSMVEGSLLASVFFALLRLRVFENLGPEGLPAEELAGRIESDPAMTRRLLDAGVSAGLIRVADGRFRVAEGLESFLVEADGDRYIADYLRYMDYLCGAVAKLDETVRTGAPSADLRSDHVATEGLQRAFTLGMHNYAVFRGSEIVDFLDIGDATRLLDVGCGPGSYSFALAEAHPRLEVFLLDLPEALEVTRDLESRYDVAGRVHYIPADCTRDEIPGDYDIALVSNMMHMLGEAESRKLLRRLHERIRPGGSVVVQAQYLNDDRRGGRWPVFLDLIMGCTAPDARNHAFSETRSWIEEAGFVDVELQRMTLYNTNSYLRGHRR